MPRLYTYETVNTLPKGAMTVSQFATLKGCDTSYIYHLLKRGKCDFKIIVFAGINWVVKEEK